MLLLFFLPQPVHYLNSTVVTTEVLSAMREYTHDVYLNSTVVTTEDMKNSSPKLKKHYLNSTVVTTEV